MFQSTRPARGATAEHLQGGLHRVVSIHAPRAGRDERGERVAREVEGFNPRAPRGARPHGTRKRRNPRRFQSTRPARGATIQPFGNSRSRLVSIHAPRAGRDILIPSMSSPSMPFQSTRPARGAT